MAVVPKKAVVGIVAREDPALRVLMVKRNPSLRFMGGHHVFPGGRIDECERIDHVLNAQDEVHACAVQAVAREVFEETGILCVRGAIPPAEERRKLQAAVLSGALLFHDLLAEHGFKIDANEFEPAGAWVTPKPLPIRFDTQYFLHRLKQDQEPSFIEGEVVGLEWFDPREARHQWHRGEIHVSTPVAYVLHQLAAKPLDEALELLRRRTERAPGEHNRFEIRRGITIIPLLTRTIPPATHTNCIVVGEEELYVIDPGSDEPEELTHLQTQLDHFLDLGGAIKAVILSHSHPDHIAGAPFLRERYSVPVWAHPETARQIDLPVDRFIEDNELIVSGGEPEWRLRAYHTPGHDPGHLAFVEESTGVLLAGDMIANPGTIVVSLEHGGDMSRFIQSLERLMEVECKVIVPSHGAPEGKPRERLQQHRDHRLWRERKIKEAYEKGAQGFETLLAASYDDAPEAALPLARQALKAHLARLSITL